jgi:hypothetical protein
MSTSVFKGSIGTGTLAARFRSDISNLDADLLILAYSAIGGGNPQVDRDASAPGGAASTKVTGAQPGILEVFVSTGQATDSGRLDVSLNGTVVHDEPILGPVRWVYSVETT